jgi:class 3 adenylate cyclase
MPEWRYNSLEDFLATNPLSVDGQGDDGGGVAFPVKGREIEATILFSDISGFSKWTLELSPAETLIFVNNFFAWISVEALHGKPGIVDKYIGDEIMVVFSREFGSEDAFVDAVQTAARMCENDALAFTPHIGIASGPVIVGYVGTPIKYNCSVFGAAVALAARCASVKPDKPEDEGISRIVFPTSEWNGRNFNAVFPVRTLKGPSGEPVPLGPLWKLRAERNVPMKNLGENVPIREICKLTRTVPHEFTTETRAKSVLEAIRQQGRYWPTLPTE